MSINLQFNYAVINLGTGQCLACATFSYEIINDAYISVPDARDAYVGKYYNKETELWYYDAQFTQIFDIDSI